MGILDRFRKRSSAGDEIHDGGWSQLEDRIEPVRILHSVDEIYADGEMEQEYNFLDYIFERDGVTFRARAYLDSVYQVALYGPFDAASEERIPSAPEMKRDILGYLRRRFSEIQSLDPESSTYVTIWSSRQMAERPTGQGEGA